MNLRRPSIALEKSRLSILAFAVTNGDTLPQQEFYYYSKRVAPHTKPKARPGHTPPPLHPPKRWRWRCHRCKSPYYRMECTRRCLLCNRRFCSARCKVKFDYRGWAAWGSYRRTAAATRAGAAVRKKQKAIETVDMVAWAGENNHEPFASFKLTSRRWKRRNGRLSRLIPVWRPVPGDQSEELLAPL
ncbi:hypothetical protein N658DRAFT_489848 [Parathielavia hyrcaniae]|uniref:Uncharacterized protein n=1 Tax=Parathielavia hyrcaniae TaxID=113614 RepID=A0AAN6PV21_9PEZI|nr:hypothetical protein N658DRAFT_489848 [Parathielavia hyrcaniae]